MHMLCDACVQCLMTAALRTQTITHLLHLARDAAEKGCEAADSIGPRYVEVCDDDEELCMHDHGLRDSKQAQPGEVMVAQ